MYCTKKGEIDVNYEIKLLTQYSNFYTKKTLTDN